MKSLSVPFLACVLVATGCFGQDRCVALIQHGLYNTYRSSSGNSNLSQAQAQFCSDYSSYEKSGVTANLSASYGLFSGSAGATVDQMKSVGQAMCSSSFSYSAAHDELNNFASIVDPNVTDAFNKCVDAAKSGLMYDLNPSAIDPNTISISVYYQIKGTIPPQHIDSVTVSQDANLEQSQTIKCDGTLYSLANKEGGKTLDQNVLGMTCVRSGKPQGFDYYGQKVYDAPARITVNTNVGQITADLPLIPVNRPTPAPAPATLVPVGTIMAYGGGITDDGNGEPSGWMLCNGRVLSRMDYRELFAAIGVAHGAGDGVLTFNLPDYRGRFLRGVSTDKDNRDPDRGNREVAQNGGNKEGVGSVQNDAVGPHKHFVANSAAMSGTAGTYEYTSNPNFPANHYTDSNVDNPTLKKETRPINAAVNFLIKVR